MLINTRFDKMVNLTHFSIIQLDCYSQDNEGFHTIWAIDPNGEKVTLEQIRADEKSEKCHVLAQRVYTEIFNRCKNEKTAFDLEAFVDNYPVDKL